LFQLEILVISSADLTPIPEDNYNINERVDGIADDDGKFPIKYFKSFSFINVRQYYFFLNLEMQILVPSESRIPEVVEIEGDDG
jgi:hypothetical protein